MPPVEQTPADGTEYLLTVSIVTFKPDIAIFRRTLESLVAAFSSFERNQVKVFVIQNSDSNAVPPTVAALLRDYRFEIIAGHGNIGYGSAHNLVLSQVGRYHLILNPDIDMEPKALINAIHFMSHNLECGLLTPQAQWPNGEHQYLCKSYPTVLDLLLRGFAPASVRKFFTERLNRYEMKLQTAGAVYWDPPIVSGCFMFFRSAVLKKINGFDPSYFLYFEDFDLSLRTSQVSRIVYVPMVNVKHAGGHAARKGLKHLFMFARSALTFYSKHGLRLF